MESRPRNLSDFMSNHTAVYPGTFDPLTMGHFDLIVRSRRIFSKLTIAVAGLSVKPTGMFTIADRMRMVRDALDEAGLQDVTVEPLDCLLTEFCRKRNVQVVVRGLRAYSDFEYEFQMALTNRKLDPDIETMFMMPNEEHSYVTASTVREIARYGGDTSQFVPPSVQRHLSEYLSKHPELQLRKGGGVGDTGAFDR